MPDQLCAYDIWATDGPCETCGLPKDWQLHGEPDGNDHISWHPWLGLVLKRCGHEEGWHLPATDAMTHEVVVRCVECDDPHAFKPGVRCETCWGDGEVQAVFDCGCPDSTKPNRPCPAPDCISGVVPVEEVVDA